MLPPFSALRARSCSAPASATCRWLLAALIGFHAASGGSVAAERLVLGNVSGDQDNPSLSIGSSGGYIAWEDNRVQTGREGKGIAAAAVSAGLQDVGEPFKVSVQKDGRQERPQVVALAGGNYLFLWEVRNGKAPGLYARVLGTNGAFTGNDALVSVPTSKFTYKVSTNWTAPYRGVVKSRKHKFKELITNTREQAGSASVVALPDGGALIAYHAMRRSDTNSCRLEERTLLSKGQFIRDSVLRPYRTGNDWMQDIFIQRLDAQGKKVGDEILVNQTTDFNQRTPSLGVLPGGNIVVAWVSEAPPSGDLRASATNNFHVSIVARVVDAQGQPVTDEFAIGNVEGRAQANPAVAGLNTGGFLVCWSQQDGIGRGWDVYARSFLADGSATGASFRVNAYTTGEQFAPQVAVRSDEALIVWTSVGQDGSREGVYGRRLRSGALHGDEFRVNETTVSRQWHPAVGTDGNGGAVVLWSGFTGESGLDLFKASFPLGGVE